MARRADKNWFYFTTQVFMATSVCGFHLNTDIFWAILTAINLFVYYAWTCDLLEKFLPAPLSHQKPFVHGYLSVTIPKSIGSDASFAWKYYTCIFHGRNISNLELKLLCKTKQRLINLEFQKDTSSCKARPTSFVLVLPVYSNRAKKNMNTNFLQQLHYSADFGPILCSQKK